MEVGYMEAELAGAFLMAIITFILALLLGSSIASVLGMIGRAALLIPILLVFLAGAIIIITADPATSANVAEATSAWSINYIVGKLPGVILSEFAGAVVGMIGGFMVRLVATLGRL